MHHLKSGMVIILTAVCQLVYGQEKKQTLNPEKAYTIPFQLTAYNNLSVQAILNQKDTVQLMFHTAANALTLTQEATQKLKTLHFDETTDGVQSWGGQANSSRMSKHNSLQIGKLKWENVYIWENTNSGQNTDGKFGIDLFENKVIAIDFDIQTIEIRANLPRRIRKYAKLPLTFKNDNLFVTANCIIGDSTFGNQFLLHSGYSGDLLFDDNFVSAHKLGEKLKIIGEKDLKDSFGNVIKTKKAILPSLKIGNTSLSDVPVGFFEGAIGRQKMSIMGGAVLKRFNLVIDAKRAFIYVIARVKD